MKTIIKSYKNLKTTTHLPDIDCRDNVVSLMMSNCSSAYRFLCDTQILLCNRYSQEREEKMTCIAYTGTGRWLLLLWPKMSVPSVRPCQLKSHETHLSERVPLFDLRERNLNYKSMLMNGQTKKTTHKRHN